MIFNKEDKLYLDVNDTCHICKKNLALVKREITVMKQVNIEALHVRFVI